MHISVYILGYNLEIKFRKKDRLPPKVVIFPEGQDTDFVTDLAKALD